jgi:uncharacterized protein (TIGR03437 family)
MLILAGSAAAQSSGWNLIWSDEFDGAANTPPNPANWTYDLGGGGWGNSELETYTNSTQNVYQDGQGHLVIQALESSPGSYTSGRVKTQGLFSFAYGRIEARIKPPYGAGIWPAFWMLGSDIDTVNWPECGEIDIMENFGADTSGGDDGGFNHGSLHGPGYTGTGLTGEYDFPPGQSISNDFHVFAVEWDPTSIQFFVDGNLFETQTLNALPAGDTWEFNNTENPFFIIMNVAIGGIPGYIASPANTPFPQQMLVDWVRVYQPTTIGQTTPSIAPGGVVSASSNLVDLSPGSLATVYGVNLSDSVYANLFDSTSGSFMTSTSSGVSVTVNGVAAPLIYASSTQINFQIPWETSLTPTSPAMVQVLAGGNLSNVQPITLATAAPSAFITYANDAAILSCYENSPVTAGAVCTLYGNGFGPKNGQSQDGVPAPANPSPLTLIEVPGSPASCELSIAGVPATVLYCGSAPGEVIDQLNFTYPAGIPVSTTPTYASLTVNGITGQFFIPSPSQ